MTITQCAKWLWHQSGGFRVGIAIRAAIGLARVGATLAFIYASKRLVDIATGYAPGSITCWAAILCGCIVCQLLLGIAMTRMNVSMSVRFTNTLRHTLFSHIMQSRWLGRESLHTGDMLERLRKDVDTVADLICSSFPSAVVTTMQLIAALVFLMALDWRLATVLVFIMPIAILIGKSYIRRMHRLTSSIRATDSAIHTHMQEHLRHRTLDATLEQTDEAIDKLDDEQQTLRRQILSRNNYSLFSRTMVQAGFAFGYVTAFLWGVHGLHTGAITFGIMTAFLQLVAQVQRPVVDLSRQLPDFIYALASAERLQQLADLPAEERGEPIYLSSPTGLRLTDIDYTYPDGQRKIFTSFSHDFQPGSLTAVIGPTGVGKSTLMRLMLALLIPDNGRVELYDKFTTVQASPRTRCNIVYVPQGNTLLSGTIRQNLLMGNPNATEEQLREALHTAVADFVYDLPDGLESYCGESGIGLSEGQAQRIAIARGLLRPGSIIMLDEPSSALDADTESTMLHRLADTLGTRTLIIITHRPQTATLCQSTLTISED